VESFIQTSYTILSQHGRATSRVQANRNPEPFGAVFCSDRPNKMFLIRRLVLDGCPSALRQNDRFKLRIGLILFLVLDHESRK
jgi:hypothetical protein